MITLGMKFNLRKPPFAVPVNTYLLLSPCIALLMFLQMCLQTMKCLCQCFLHPSINIDASQINACRRRMILICKQLSITTNYYKFLHSNRYQKIFLQSLDNGQRLDLVPHSRSNPNHLSSRHPIVKGWRGSEQVIFISYMN